MNRMTVRGRCIGALVFLSACLKPPTSLGPRQLTVSHSTADAVRIASGVLTQAGFDISSSDAKTGTVIAKRTRTPDQQRPDIACGYAQGSIESTRAQATMTLTVTAQTVGRGTHVVMSAVVRTDLSGLPNPPQPPINETECVSSGVIEARILDALR
jgi:hypothetical protein